MAVPADNVSGAFYDVRPLYPAGLWYPRRKRISEHLRRVWVWMQSLRVLSTLVSTMWMGWATNGPGYELIMLLTGLYGCLSHFNLSFSDPMPQAWGHGAQLRFGCGEGSDDRPSSLDRDGSIRGSRLSLHACRFQRPFWPRPMEDILEGLGKHLICC